MHHDERYHRPDHGTYNLNVSLSALRVPLCNSGTWILFSTTKIISINDTLPATILFTMFLMLLMDKMDLVQWSHCLKMKGPLFGVATSNIRFTDSYHKYLYEMTYEYIRSFWSFNPDIGTNRWYLSYHCICFDLYFPLNEANIRAPIHHHLLGILKAKVSLSAGWALSVQRELK